MTIEVGLKTEQRRVVEKVDCISFLGDDVTPSLSTPRMILWMEVTAREALLSVLPAGRDSVGVRVEIDHLSATPLGATVQYTAEVVSIDKRRVRFSVQAHDGVAMCGQGFHDRFVVDVERFAEGLKKRFSER